MTRPSPQTARRLIGLSLIVLWEAIPRLGILPELFIPPLTKTLYVLWLDRAIYGRRCWSRSTKWRSPC